MGAINQGDVATVNSCGFAEFAGGVVAQVGGNVHLRVGGAHSVKEGVTGTTAEGNPANRLVGTARDAQPAGGGRQGRREAFCKLLEGDFFGQGAEAAGAYRVFLFVKYLGLCFSERFAVNQADSVTECFVHAFNGGICVGVRAEQSASAFDKGVQYIALVVAVGDELCAAEQQRVMGDEQLRAFGYGFFSGGGEGVYCEEDGTHFSGATSGDEAGCVPSGGKLRREERVEGIDDFCKGGGF